MGLGAGVAAAEESITMGAAGVEAAKANDESMGAGVAAAKANEPSMHAESMQNIVLWGGQPADGWQLISLKARYRAGVAAAKANDDSMPAQSMHQNMPALCGVANQRTIAFILEL